MRILVHKPDGSFEGRDGEVVFFSAERLERDIIRGDCCFICGAAHGAREFNDEHIIPRWILRKFDLYDKRIGLPNNTTIPYRQYTIPCCVSCNSELNEYYEKPVREVLEGGIQAVGKHLREEGPLLLFSWLALLFLKTHLKDWRLRFDSDRRSGDMRMVGDLIAHQLGELHHLHCLVRGPFVGSSVKREVVGTFFAFAADPAVAVEQFDYGDFFPSRSLLLRYGDVALIAVLDDACAAFSRYRDEAKRLTAPLNPMQLREVLGNVSYIAANLLNRPTFGSSFEPDGHVIWCKHPDKVELKDPPSITLGNVLVHCLGSALACDPDRERILELLRGDRFTFLFDQDGRQIRVGAEPRWIRRQ